MIVDLDGDEDQDVAIGTAKGLALLDGSTGAELEADVHWRGRMSFASSHKTSPAVGELNGERYLVYVANSPDLKRTRVAAYRLPATGSSDAWPMFRHGPTRVGTASISRPGTWLRTRSLGQLRFLPSRFSGWLEPTSLTPARERALRPTLRRPAERRPCTFGAQKVDQMHVPTLSVTCPATIEPGCCMDV